MPCGMPPGVPHWGSLTPEGALLLAGTADLTAHGAHSAIVAAGLCLLVFLLRPAPAAPPAFAVARLRRTARSGRLVEVATRQALAVQGRARPDPALRAAAVGSVAASWIHALVAGDHLAASALTGGFFLAAALAQAAWAAALLLRPSYAVLAAGCAGHLAMVGIWLASRTVGAQAVGVVDALAVTYELLAVGAAVLVLRRMTSAPLPSDWRRSGPALAVGGAVILALVGL